MKMKKMTKEMLPSKKARHSIFKRIVEWLYALVRKIAPGKKAAGKLPHPISAEESKSEEYEVNMLKVEQQVIMREIVTDILSSYIETFITNEVSTKYTDGGGYELARWTADELKGIVKSHGYGALPMKTKIFLGGVISKKTHQYRKLLAKFGEIV